MSRYPSILLVDDDAPLRLRLAKALEARGHAVTAHDNPGSALEAAKAEEFFGAVVDLRMPGGDGLDVIRQLRACQPSLRIVLLTGYGSIANALEAVRLGALDYLTKPADADQILAALRGERAVREGPAAVPDQTPSLDRVEWEHIQRVLADCGGNISQAARTLHIDRRSLQRKLGKIPPPR